MEVALEEAVARVFPAGVERIAPLEGGLTNDNHQVWTTDGHFVLRRWRDDDGLLSIDREAEHVNAVRAARAGVAPAVVAYAPEVNAMVVAWVDGTTLRAQDLRGGGHLEDVADACRRLHAGERFATDFDMFETQARYREVVRRHGFPLPEDYDAFASPVAAIREALAVHAGPTVPCHNDLLAENLMLCDDRVVIVDYEYGGNNDALFELGNLWSESALSLPQLEQLITAYAGRATPRDVARARLWALMSLHGWTLWGAIQSASSPLDFDFWSWGTEKHDRAVAGFDDPIFEQLLAEARRE